MGVRAVQSVILIGLLGWCSGGNILGLLPLPLFSHTNTYMPLFVELAARGHNVTVISPFPPKAPIKNLNHINVENIMPDGPPNVNAMLEWMQSGGSWLLNMGFWYYGQFMSNEALKLQPVKDLMKDTDSKFDLVVLETFFMQEPLIAFGYKFGAPVVNLNPAEPSAWVSYLTGTPLPYSYVPSLSIAATDQMCFTQRLKNTLMNSFEVLSGRYYYIRQQDALMRMAFDYPGSENLPPLLDMLMNTSLTLVDSHFSMGYPRPYHNNIVEIGGLSIEEKPSKLPLKIKKFIEEAPEGIIYFSTGSWIKSSDLKAELLTEIKETFRSLKQRVLWKWDGPPMDNKPDNLMIEKWFPQNAILSHEKCKLFITHGGIHSVIEAAYHGVPVVGLPLMADQPHNLKFVEYHGMGLTHSFVNLTREKFTKAITTVIEDPSFKKNTMLRSAMLKDRPMVTLKNAVYWMEYVMRHKGASHLRPASLTVGWCRYLLLDVLSLLAAAVALACYLAFAICRCCCRPCCRSKRPTKKSKIHKTD